jgi:restriction endonuclease S subunit
MPSMEEQKRIAATLDDLDHLITLHQHKSILMKNAIETQKIMLINSKGEEKCQN